MKKENVIFLAAGVVFGIVVGFLVAYMIFHQEEINPAQKRESPKGSSISEMQQPPEHIDIMQEIESLKKLLQQDPSNYAALVRLGNLYFDAVKFPQAIEYYAKAIAIKDDDPNVFTDLGICYRNTGDPRKAIEFFEKANQKDPSHWQSLYNIIIVAMNDTSDLTAAESALQRLERIKPDVEGIDMVKKQIEAAKEKKGK
ncbi:MAG: tetratricopeptide repeat protein [Acidobacteriota bacterium]